MRILIAYPMPVRAVKLLGRTGIAYRPDLAEQTGPRVWSAIGAFRPDVIVADKELDPADLESWRRLMPAARRFVVFKGSIADGEEVATDVRGGLSIHRVGADGPDADLEVLRQAERLYNRHVTCAASRATVQRRRGHESRGGESVAVVGAGIVGLMTALRLTGAGYRVRILESCPDPRSSDDWRTFGCTSGGGNARMVTLTEADNYNDQDGSGLASQLFREPVSRCGWRVCSEQSLGPVERGWINVHEQLAPWLARAFNQDVFAFNKESRSLWEELRSDRPGLFEGVELREDILRLYTDPAHLEHSVARHQAIGAFRARLEPRSIRSRYPAIADACDSGLLAGGVEVVGFTVNVHDFVSKLLDRLEGAGTVMSWNTRVREVVRDGGGRVAALATAQGTVEADHYVLSPGVYGEEMLTGTASAGLIQGVLGVWMTIPNLVPKLRNSLKVARKGHMAEDANVTVAKDAWGADVLVYGSGYGYTGLQPDNILPEQLEALYEAVEENVQAFFPRAHAAALNSGLLRSSRRLCVRPWTPTGLGVLEVVPATSGLLIVTGGHNTGGFTQSPSVAEAVLAALQGRTHPMHELYHPHRCGQAAVARAEAAGHVAPVLAETAAVPHSA